MEVVKTIILFGGLLVLTSVTLTVTGESVDRHNFGFVWHRMHEVSVSTAAAKMIFHYKLPDNVLHIDRSHINCSRRVFAAIRGTVCYTIRRLLTEFRNLRVKVQEHVKTQVENLYEVLYDFPINDRRSKRGFLTDALGQITGLATYDELTELTDVLQQVEIGVERAAEAWKTGNNHFMSVFQIVKTRLDNVHSVIEMQRKSILRLQSELVGHWAQSNTRAHFMAEMIKTVAELVFQVSEIDDLYSAMQMLNVGKLPHFLVHHKTLSSALAYIQQHLENNHPDLKLLRLDHQYYYAQAKFRVFRFNLLLVVVVDVPLTFHALVKPLTLYQLVKIPLIAPHASDHYNILEAEIAAAAYHRDSEFMVVIRDLKNLPQGSLWDLRKLQLSLITRAVPTCASALFEGDLTDIKRLCAYHIYKARIPRGITKLGRNMFLFTNISKLVFDCGFTNETTTITLQEIQTVHQLNCSCVIWADEFFLPHDFLQCDLDNISVTYEAKFMVNLPYLTEFFDDQLLEYISEDLFLNDTITAVLPPLAIAGKTYEAKMALEKKAAYDLVEVLNETKEDSLVYSDLSHYLYNVLLSSHTHNRNFDWFNFYDWLLVLATACGGVALILVIMVKLRVRTIMVMLAAVRGANAVENFNQHKVPRFLHFSTAMPTAQLNFSAADYFGVLREILPVDVLILLCLILLLLLLLAYFIYQVRCRSYVRTTLLLEIGNKVTKNTWHVADLSYSPGFYKILVNPGLVSVRLTELFWSASVNWSRGVTILNAAIEMAVTVPDNLPILPWRLTAMRTLMSNEYYVALLVVNGLTSELVEVVKLKTLPRIQQGRETSMYPAVELQSLTA